MNYAFRCDKTGLVEFAYSADGHPCPHCGKAHETYQCGAPKEAGQGSVVPDFMHKHYDWAAGCEITSRSQRNRVYAEKGLNVKSAREFRKQHNLPDHKHRFMSYPGQKDHRSSAETGGVRTKTGQKVN